MKQREGFVSNSSSSSFVLVGFHKPDQGTIEKVKSLPKAMRKQYYALVEEQTIRCDEKDYDGRDWWDEDEIGEVYYLGIPIMSAEGGEDMDAQDFLKKSNDTVLAVVNDLGCDPKTVKAILTEWSH